MSGIDYALFKIRGIVFDVDGVLSPSTIPVDQFGRPNRMFSVKDGYALQLAVRQGLHIAVITGGKSDSMAARMRLLGITDYWQNVSDKLPILLKWMKMHSLKMDEVAYMGDDIPDLRCLRHVGLPCCPHDASWEVKQESIYISPFAGGYGAARDLIEQVLKAHGKWDSESLNLLLW